MFAHMGQRNINSMFTGNAVAVILIMLVLMVALRSWKLGLLSVLPNAIPALITIGLWGHVRGEVNMAVALIFVVSLGIVVDDTVHFLSKYLRARRTKSYDPAEAIRYAFDTVGNALVITSLVLTAGFLVLTASLFQVNAVMGLLVAITILVALVFDFAFLPGLLMWLDRKQKSA
jgi:predicted RND superfamily exporter protein